jgi:hypothetical protein
LSAAKQAVSVERVSDPVVEAPLEGGDETLAPVVGEVHRPRGRIEVQARLLSRFLLGDITEYPNFTTR